MNADRLIDIIIICIGLELTAKEAHFSHLAMYYSKISFAFWFPYIVQPDILPCQYCKKSKCCHLYILNTATTKIYLFLFFCCYIIKIINFTSTNHLIKSPQQPQNTVLKITH